MEETRNEKLETIEKYFSEIGVEIPIPVKNAIEDVFDENDTIDNVDVYMKEDAESFLDDVSFKDIVSVDLSGKSFGSRHNTFTYYGDVVFDENLIITLNRNETLLETIEDVSSPFTTEESPMNISHFDEKDWAVVLIEHITWEAPCEKEERKNLLVIYCPESGDEDED
jgi:hypothetical protein